MRGVRIVVIVLLLVAAGVGVIFLTGSGRGNAVEQPIAFSHKIHAGQNQIPCLYCHANARRSAVAGVPSVQRCMSCHRSLAADKDTADKPGIEKLKEYWEKEEPIPWVRVYDQPDFVRFSHKRHVLKEITCETCHGPVETMDQIEAVVILNMDRCVSCHMERRASIDCWTCHR
jgi:hypothetical protein